METFCNNKLTFYYQYSAANVFLLSEPLVPEHVQRKERFSGVDA